MAIAKTATVVSAERVGAQTCVVELEAAAPLGFVGGQYIIVDSGLVLPSGKAAKRAYSIMSADAEQRRFRLAVKRIPDGLASGFMHGLAPDAVVAFSGPWGKLGPAIPSGSGASGSGAGGSGAGASGASGAGASGAGASGVSATGATDGDVTRGAGVTTALAGTTLLLATDTGISAALGLVQAARMHGRLPSTVLIWLQVDGEDFLPAAFVRAHIPASCGAVRLAAIPPIGHPERIPYVRAVLANEMARARDGIAQAFISGDGAVNYALLDDLVAAGVPATRDSVESFFNMPKKSA